MSPRLRRGWGGDLPPPHIWLTLGEYTLGYETYLMPAPEEQVPDVYEMLLRAFSDKYLHIVDNTTTETPFWNVEEWGLKASAQ